MGGAEEGLMKPGLCCLSDNLTTIIQSSALTPSMVIMDLIMNNENE